MFLGERRMQWVLLQAFIWVFSSPNEESQELVDKAFFCDWTEVLFWGVFVPESQVLLKYIINTVSFKLVWCAFISELLGGENCFNCLYVNAEELGACFHPSVPETWNETQANFQMVADPGSQPLPDAIQYACLYHLTAYKTAVCLAYKRGLCLR